jgi:hypothetical protein
VYAKPGGLRLPAVTTGRNETDALHPTIRAAIGGALMMLGLTPVLLMFREQAWSAVHGYATATIAMPFFVLIQLARGGKISAGLRCPERLPRYDAVIRSEDGCSQPADAV